MRSWAPWAGALVAALVLSSPLAALVYRALEAPAPASLDAWVGTLVSGGVAVVVAVLVGGGAAWFSTLYSFPGRGLFSVLVVLPMALPPYLAAYAWSGFLEYSGPLSTLVQALGGSPLHHPPQGALFLGLLLGLQLYPYVYLTTRPALASGLAAPLEAALVLGRRGWPLFFRPGLGLLRPFLAAGAAFVLMESLNEYGAAVHLGVPTLTTDLFRLWHHAYNLPGALGIALQLCGLAGVLLWIERLLRRARRFSGGTQRHGAPFPGQRLTGWPGVLGAGLAFIPVILGLGIPVFQLVWWSLVYPQPSMPWVEALGNSLGLSLGVGATATMAALAAVFFFSARRRPLVGPRTVVDVLASLGYAVPGVLGALAVVVGAGALGMNAAVGSLALLGYALAIRYFAVGYSSVDAGFRHRSALFDAPARVLGKTTFQVLGRVHLPLMAPSVGFAFLLLVLDLVKELSMTLLLRPLGFETLPTLLYEQATQELPQLTAIPGLVLLVATVSLVLVLSRRKT